MNFFNADRLTGKDGAEVNLFVSQTDATTVAHDDDLVVKGIIDVGQSVVGTGGGLIDLGRAFHGESFMRALLVKDLDKVIEAGLLQPYFLCSLGGERVRRTRPSGRAPSREQVLEEDADTVRLPMLPEVLFQLKTLFNSCKLANVNDSKAAVDGLFELGGGLSSPFFWNPQDCH